MDPLKCFITTLLGVLLIGQKADANCYGGTTNIDLSSRLNESFTSPGYPYTYPSNKDCKWLITAPEGQRVLLYFTSFDLEDEPTCDYDSVEVYDGSSSLWYSSLAKRCGSEIPPPVYSSGRNLLVVFQSDFSVEGKGFAAYVSTLSNSTACPSIGTSSSVGVIYSPGFPWSYPNNKFCRWYIRAPYGMKINLTFTKVDLGTGPISCSSDYVEIEDRYGARIQKICGYNYVNTLTSPSNVLQVEFHTDYSVSYSGFIAYYQYTNHVPTTPYPRWTTRTYPWWTTRPYPWWTTGHVASYSCDLGSEKVLQVESSAMIASPGYPSQRLPASSTSQYSPICTWKVETKDSDYLELTFDVMSIERCGSYCSCGRVTVGEYEYNSDSLGTFCMGRASSTVKSKGETMYIKYFASERSDTFKATIRAKKTKISVPGIVVPIVAAVILFGIIFVIVRCVRPIPSSAQPGPNITEVPIGVFPPASQNVASSPPDLPPYAEGIVNEVADNNA